MKTAFILTFLIIPALMLLSACVVTFKPKHYYYEALAEEHALLSQDRDAAARFRKAMLEAEALCLNDAPKVRASEITLRYENTGPGRTCRPAVKVLLNKHEQPPTSASDYIEEPDLIARLHAACHDVLAASDFIDNDAPEVQHCFKITEQDP